MRPVHRLLVWGSHSPNSRSPVAPLIRTRAQFLAFTCSLSLARLPETFARVSFDSLCLLE